jgi:hypothetical protein
MGNSYDMRLWDRNPGWQFGGGSASGLTFSQNARLPKSSGQFKANQLGNAAQQRRTRHQVVCGNDAQSWAQSPRALRVACCAERVECGSLLPLWIQAKRRLRRYALQGASAAGAIGGGHRQLADALAATQKRLPAQAWAGTMPTEL